jgi:sporulation-control protein spo0M
MRAFHFARPFEYRLEIPNDDAMQGSLLQGTLTLVSQDTQRRTGLHLELGLAAGAFKPVKEQGVSAREFLERHVLADDFAIEPQGKKSVPWSLSLRMDCPITTKDSGMFLLYGENLDDAAKRGVIDLPVKLAPPLETFIATVENHFAFEARGRRYSDGFTHVRFKPPATYPTLEEIVVAMRIGEEGLQLQFAAKARGLARGPKSGVRSRSMELERHLPAREYLLANGQPNRELYRKVIQDVLSEVTPAALINAPAD